MANVNLPSRFKNILETDQQLDGIVKSTLFTFGDILEQNKLYFFGEYTDHGIKHIQDVLFSSDNLITDDTYSILGHKDIGYYILSVILHDIGMHIDLQGFICLLEGEFDDVRIESLDSETWKNLWDNYIGEAKKFSGKQLKSIFGDETVIIRTPPFENQGLITEYDKKLIGEFLRQHHPRLAHEIAIKGFPGKPDYIEFVTKLENRSKNIIGLIARSHGTNLRVCLDNIESIYGRESRRFPNGIHATFLMILLRIADYIQIDSNRTSIATIKNKTFSSPISAVEHDAHLAIDNVDYKWHDDPERIFVTALPKDSQMYLKLKKLFKDIQDEFDMSWAVLGELYGKSVDAKPQIKYRRINSNLENKSFTSQQEYVADSFSFKTNEEIIKLMVAPLYGDDIKYGVRELLQNSIDAVKEREFIEKRNNNLSYKPEVIIKIQADSDNSVYFIITDNGIGMDKEIIKNYFLSAGASYRKSLNWQKEFLDDTGNAIVRRSGRFGVGMLSAFLIGNEIHVETKKLNNTEGYKLNAGLNTDLINIIKDNTIEYGTSIKIKIDSQNIEKFIKLDRKTLRWLDWFCLKNPTVKYYIYDKRIFPYKNPESDYLDPTITDWNAVDSLGYSKILWTYNRKYGDHDFMCNGIVIPDAHELQGQELVTKYPKISVFDNSALLPLTLDRNSISESPSFKNDLLEDIYKDFIAYLLTFDKNSYVDNESISINNKTLNYPAFNYYHTDNYESLYGKNAYKEQFILTRFVTQILISKNGFVLNYNYFIQKLGLLKMVLIQFENLKSRTFTLDLKDRFLLLTETNLNSISDFTSALQEKSWNEDNDEKEEKKSFNIRVYMKAEKYDYLFKSDKRRIPLWLAQKCKFDSEISDISCIVLDNPKEGVITTNFIEEYSSNINFIREYDIECSFEGDPIFNKLLHKYIGDDVIIPFKVEERRNKFPLAFKELNRYIEKYNQT